MIEKQTLQKNAEEGFELQIPITSEMQLSFLFPAVPVRKTDIE